MTPEQVTCYAAEAEAARRGTEPQEVVMGRLVDELILPAWQAGRRHIALPLRYQNRQVSMNHDRWVRVLKSKGVHVDHIEWSCDQRSWQGPLPVAGESMPMVLA